MSSASRPRRVQVRTRNRRYCITLNNPTSVECVAWQTVLSDGAKDVSFFICQTERETTLHYQAYVEFKKAVSWTAVKAIFGDRIHLEVSRGSSAANIRYCTKNESRITGEPHCLSGQWGIPKRGGGVVMVAVKVQNGETMESITADFPSIVMLHGPKVEAFMARTKGSRTEKPKITILFGETGCGKSQYCVNTLPGAYWVAPPKGGAIWWGHYTGQDVCVFDDFHDHWFMLTKLLRIMDSTPLFVAPKGDQVPFTSKHLVFTSNVDPRDWYSAYKGRPAHKDALERRIVDFAEIIDCRKELVPTPHGPVYIYHREKRNAVFSFRDSFGDDFAISAGVGDMNSGNGFF